MTRPRRPASLFARLLGVVLLVPGLLQVPLPQVDFHIVRHSHGAGQVCSHHDHLLRWHPRAGEGEDVAVLHWHWLLPRSIDPATLDASTSPLPAIHAHDGEHERNDLAAGHLLVRDDRGRESRGEAASPHSPLAADFGAGFLGLDLRPAAGSSSDLHAGRSPSTPALAALVRRNC